MPAELGWRTLAVTVGYLAFHLAFLWGLVVKYYYACSE